MITAPTLTSPAHPLLPHRETQRACTFIQMLPAIASLAISITCIAAALLYKNPYMTIPPAVGLFISCYFIVISLHLHKLKSFQENNEAFAAQVDTLAQENKQLKETKESLASEVGNLQKERNELHVITCDQRLAVTTLEETVASAKHEHQEHVASLTKITEDLTLSLGILANFTGKQEEMTKLSFEQWSTHLLRSEKCQKAGEELVTNIRDTFSQFCAQDAIQQRKKELKKLNNLVQQHKGVLALLKKQVKALDKTREEFALERERLGIAVDRIAEKKLQEEMDELTGMTEEEVGAMSTDNEEEV